MNQIAENLVRWINDRINPGTILLIDCRDGEIVEEFRKKNIEAFGLYLDEGEGLLASSQNSCKTGKLSQPLERTYDVILSLADLTDLSPSERTRLVENWCVSSSEIIFQLPELDFAHPEEMDLSEAIDWIRLFWAQGFIRYQLPESYHIPQVFVHLHKDSPDPNERIVPVEYERIKSEQEGLIRHHIMVEQSRELTHIGFLLNQMEQYGEMPTQSLEEILGVDKSALSEVKNLSIHNYERQQLIHYLSKDLVEIRHKNEFLQKRVFDLEAHWAQVEKSMGWRVARRMTALRLMVAPPGGWRAKVLQWIFELVRPTRGANQFGTPSKINLKKFPTPTFERVGPYNARSSHLQIDPRALNPSIQIQQKVRLSSVDVVICVHNALEDVKRCLESVERWTSNYGLILVDDGSEPLTAEFLTDYAHIHHAQMLRNNVARGYTCAANQGIQQSSADYAMLLNSDTIVTPNWLEQMIACAEQDERIGFVGPLSNTASWQSIPKIEEDGDWATNPLPEGVTVEMVGQMVKKYSGHLYPRMTLLNGFCLLIRRAVIRQVGLFDEERFGPGYGEEDDLILRARKAGWALALADDTYIYHAQSRSYSNDRRKQLSKRAGDLLVEKHGAEIIQSSVAEVYHNRVLDGLRARSQVMFARQADLQVGQGLFSGRRILFVLPIAHAGGGGNVVISESMAMRAMGVEVTLFNLNEYRESFLLDYPALEIPVIFGLIEDIPGVSATFDAVIATFNTSVEWIAKIPPRVRPLQKGYYIQGFEPLIYLTGTPNFETAWTSYALIPDQVRFTKTEWTRKKVKDHIGVETAVVGASVDIDLFRPRPYPGGSAPGQPIKITAMVRASSDYRSPQTTMEVLRKAAIYFGDAVQIVIFGIDEQNPEFLALPHDFPFTTTGMLTQKQMASLLNQMDVFVDFSSHQAMGLTAMEAMCCGCAVIVPSEGGATSFGQHGRNCLVIDTSSVESCWQALKTLIENENLRKRIQFNGLYDICEFYPERAALEILKTFFPEGWDDWQN